jgi:hypothetical protein
MNKFFSWLPLIGIPLLPVVTGFGDAPRVPCATCAPQPAGHPFESVLSVGTMKFVDADTLVVADWRGGMLHAMQLPPAAPVPSRSFNLDNVSAPIANAVGVRPEDLRFEDLAFRPGSERAFVSLSLTQSVGTPRPAIVSIDADGAIEVLDLVATPHRSVALTSRPGPDKMLWRNVPEATLTVTSIEFYAGKLYVAGLCDASFASTLRVYDFPFTAKSSLATVEMYHPVHDQNETRAPIRAMTIATLDGKPNLVAAYTCTPLVTIPLDALADGAHVTGKTIAELGWGSAPVDMVTFEATDGPMVLLVNSHKSGDLMSVASIAEASRKPGLTTPIQWPNAPLLGLRSTYVPMGGVAQLGDQDAQFFGLLRRSEASGAMTLLSVRKGAFLRLSAFVNEYDFASFHYKPNDAFRGLHKTLRTDEGFPDLVGRGER